MKPRGAVGQVKVTQVLLRASTGGVTEHVLTLAAEMIQEGVAVTVLANWHHQSQNGDERARFEAHGATTLNVPFPELGTRNVVVGLMKALASFRVFFWILVTKRPDILHVHWRATLPFVVTARLFRVPIVFSAHNTSLANGRVNRYLAKIPNHAVVSNQHLEEAWIRNHGIALEKVTLVPNGVGHARQGAARQLHSLPAGARGLVVCTVARLEPGKGHVTILQAISLLEGMGSEVTLLVAGDGSLRPAIERLAQELQISDRVQFLGWQSDVSATLASSHCLVLMSEAEAFPLSVIEGMSHGVVPLRTAVGGAEQVIDGETGFLIAVGDHLTLARRLRELDQDRSRLQAMSEAARDRWQANYTSETMVARMLELYRRIIAK